MHVVIIWQNDPEIKRILKPLIDRGASRRTIPVAGHHVRLHRMLSKSTLKGAWIQRWGIVSAILRTAKDALKQNERMVEMRVFFIFHQTNSAAVDAIMAALKLLEPDVLDKMAAATQKDLSVGNVFLLSCESGTDKVVPNPVPAPLVKWVEQAHNMRQSAIRAFSIRKVCSPGEYVPAVVTFSTGDPETGGLVMDPWNVKFQRLHGHFTSSGGWEYFALGVGP